MKDDKMFRLREKAARLVDEIRCALGEAKKQDDFRYTRAVWRDQCYARADDIIALVRGYDKGREGRKV